MQPRQTHEALARLHDAKAFDHLWEMALPIVDQAISGMVRRGELRAEDVDDDILQEGYLNAAAAVRGWQPMEHAFSTHIANKTRWHALEYRASQASLGIGSRKTRVVVLALPDAHEDAELSDSDGRAFEFAPALTYAGMLGAHGQLEGARDIPEDYGDPMDEASAQQLRERLARALTKLLPEQRDIVAARFGLGRFVLSIEEYALANGLSRSTAHRRYRDAIASLAQILDGNR